MSKLYYHAQETSLGPRRRQLCCAAKGSQAAIGFAYMARACTVCSASPSVESPSSRGIRLSSSWV